MTKNIKFVITRLVFPSSKCSKIRFLRPRWGAYDAPPDPPVGWGGRYPLPIPLLSRRLRRLELAASVLMPPPALKAQTDRATKLHYVKYGPIQPKPADGFKRSDDGRCFRSTWYSRFPWLE